MGIRPAFGSLGVICYLTTSCIACDLIVTCYFNSIRFSCLCLPWSASLAFVSLSMAFTGVCGHGLCVTAHDGYVWSWSYCGHGSRPWMGAFAWPFFCNDRTPIRYQPDYSAYGWFKRRFWASLLVSFGMFLMVTVGCGNRPLLSTSAVHLFGARHDYSHPHPHFIQHT